MLSPRQRSGFVYTEPFPVPADPIPVHGLGLMDLVSLMARHGYGLTFGLLLAESLGLPFPAAIALVAAGATVASHALFAPYILLAAIAALMLGDVVQFWLGRYMGWALLGVLCRVSVNPETCILRSAESFYKRGKITLVVAKFIPGVNTIAAPLAGSMKMRPGQFLSFDAMGALIYSSAYIMLGFIFRDFLTAITRGFLAAGRAVEISLFVAIIAYTIYRLWVYYKNQVYRVVPRVQVEELARKLESDEKTNILLLDVRSHGYYDGGALRIKGSIRLEPNNFAEE